MARAMAYLHPNQTIAVMEFNNKKLTRTSKFIHYVISIALAIFLIGLANRIIGDLDETGNRPMLEDFEAETEIHNYRVLYNGVQDSIREIVRDKKALQLDLDLATRTLEQEHTSFKSWISTRKATHLSSTDVEVRKRNFVMDSIQESIKKYEQEKKTLTASIQRLRDQSEHHQELIDTERDVVYTKLSQANRSYDLKIFLKRLLFVLPVLLLGIWMLLKKRKATYWPLFRGFVFFSFYAFFVGLVPYLPSYGGYVRYAIGIILSVFLGIYAIKSLQAFIKRKKKELQQSTKERSKQIKEEVAEKALENHMCPSCGKDYLINELHQSGAKKRVTGALRVTNFCRHCGLQLFKDCDNCETTNYAHLPHCYSCGDLVTAKDTPSADAITIEERE